MMISDFLYIQLGSFLKTSLHFVELVSQPSLSFCHETVFGDCVSFFHFVLNRLKSLLQSHLHERQHVPNLAHGWLYCPGPQIYSSHSITTYLHISVFHVHSNRDPFLALSIYLIFAQYGSSWIRPRIWYVFYKHSAMLIV